MVVAPTMLEAGWQALEDSIIYYRGEPVGTVAACDPDTEALNYDQCFVRDFAICAIAFLLHGRTEIVRNFLTTVLTLQSQKKQLDCFKPSKGLMPASFKVVTTATEEVLKADFGEQAIAKVAPIDSVFWWLILLQAYTKTTNDLTLAHRSEFQQGIRLILDLCLSARFDLFPTMLVPDGSFAIDRRMGVYGYPLDIQALFFAALGSARELLVASDENQEYINIVNYQRSNLTYHVRQYYWLDLDRLKQIYRYKSEEFGETAVNQFNIQASTIPQWLEGWLANDGGYFLGNVGSGRMDCRWFTQGNLVSIFTSLANQEQSEAIFRQLECSWDDLVGSMPLKICFPALEGRDWELITGSDPKNTAWSYHNGGSWPFLLVFLAAAAQKTGKPEIGNRAVEIAAQCLQQDDWLEYYDGRHGRLLGKEARKFQTWTIAGFLAAYELLLDPEKLKIICFDDTAKKDEYI
jgi:hypothetical protein